LTLHLGLQGVDLFAHLEGLLPPLDDDGLEIVHVRFPLQPLLLEVHVLHLDLRPRLLLEVDLDLEPLHLLHHLAADLLQLAAHLILHPGVDLLLDLVI
jgi:hypothetical protein